MKEPTLKLEKISKYFSTVKVLNDVSIELYPGEVHCLMGENGAGKSTLIKIISGAYTADSGVITYQNKEVSNVNPRWARENGINTIYQEIDLVPHLTSVENILLAEEPLNKLGNIDKKASQKRAEDLFFNLGVNIPLQIPVGKLQLAQQQMIAIAKALNLNSKVIIFDEPTAVFTGQEVEMLFRIIKDLKSRGIAILYISHHMEEIFEIGDRITVLRDGELVCTDLVSKFTNESLIQAMVGRNIQIKRSTTGNTAGQEILTVENLRGGIVKDVSFTLKRKEILGLGGLVGAGRTEVARMLIGADRSVSGKLTYKGKTVHIKSPMQALKLGIGMLPESRKADGIVAGSSVGDNATYSFIEKTSRYGLVSWKKVKQKAQEIIEEMTVRPKDVNKQIQYLSGGNQQKVVLGRLLAAECDVLILDEPTRGVDVGARTEIYEVIRKLRDSGKAIIMISSDMTELLTQSDRILVMSQGKVAGELNGAEANEEKVLTYALSLEV